MTSESKLHSEGANSLWFATKEKIMLLCMSAAVMLFFAGCATTSTEGNYGVLATPGCTIAAEDGSFVIKSGERFSPPFQMPFKASISLRHHLRGQDADTQLLNSYNWVYRFGAKPVRVTVPGKTEPLFGVLALFQTNPRGTGPATRSYQIQIPDTYIEAAQGGRVSAVYETYNVRDLNCYSWILWLSDGPLNGPRGASSKKSAK